MSKAIENLQAAQQRAMAGRPKVGGFPLAHLYGLQRGALFHINKLVEELRVECELAARREAGSLYFEFRRFASGPEQSNSVKRPRKEEMYGGVRACSGEFNFQRSNGAAAGLQRRTHYGFSPGYDRERLPASAPRLLEFHSDDVPVCREPRRWRLKGDNRAFPEFLKPRKRLADRRGRFPADQKAGGR